MAIEGRARRSESRREIGVAVVGTGFMGPVHVEALRPSASASKEIER